MTDEIQPQAKKQRKKPVSWLEINDHDLLSQCEVDTYRASGPGGQKRNKVSSAVRLRHGPTDTMVVATESRSQHENKAKALHRLREAIALTHRNQITQTDPLPTFIQEALKRNPGLRMNHRHTDYFKVIQYLLDLLLACQGSVADVAARLAISTAQLVRFFKCDDKLWAQVNLMRKDLGLHGLT